MASFIKAYNRSMYLFPQIISRYCASNSSKDPGFTTEGDTGFTKVDDTLISKDDQVFNAVGATRELSSYIGFAREFAIDNDHPYTDKLTRIQTLLVDIAISVTHSQSEDQRFSGRNTKEIEDWIEEYGKNLTPREKYILPGGGKAAASLHVARNVCQRAERSIVPLVNQGIVDKEILIYFNRLGDFLLTVSRFAAKTDKRAESIYSPSGIASASTAKESS